MFTSRNNFNKKCSMRWRCCCSAEGWKGEPLILGYTGLELYGGGPASFPKHTYSTCSTAASPRGQYKLQKVSLLKETTEQIESFLKKKPHHLKRLNKKKSTVNLGKH